MDARLTMSGMTDFFCHPRQWSVGIYPKTFKDGCPLHNAGHDRLFPSYPQVVGGYPSETEDQMDARLTMLGMTPVQVWISD